MRLKGDNVTVVAHSRSQALPELAGISSDVKDEFELPLFNELRKVSLKRLSERVPDHVEAETVKDSAD